MFKKKVLANKRKRRIIIGGIILIIFLFLYANKLESLNIRIMIKDNMRFYEFIKIKEV